MRYNALFEELTVGIQCAIADDEKDSFRIQTILNDWKDAWQKKITKEVDEFYEYLAWVHLYREQIHEALIKDFKFAEKESKKFKSISNYFKWGPFKELDKIITLPGFKDVDQKLSKCNIFGSIKHCLRLGIIVIYGILMKDPIFRELGCLFLCIQNCGRYLYKFPPVANEKQIIEGLPFDSEFRKTTNMVKLSFLLIKEYPIILERFYNDLSWRSEKNSEFIFRFDNDFGKIVRELYMSVRKSIKVVTVNEHRRKEISKVARGLIK